MTMRMSIPIDERHTPGAPSRAVQRWLRLFLIELRRSPALLAALGIAFVTLWVMRNALPVGVVRWREVSWSASDAMIPVSAIAAGIAAFVAGRDHRAQIEDQLVQTVAGPQRRDMLAFLAALTLSVTGYLVAVAAFFIYASIKATWNGPTWSFVYLTLATIVLGTSGGWLVGTLFPHRLSVLVAVGAALAVYGLYPLTFRFRTEQVRQPDGNLYINPHEGWYKNLLPREMLDYFDIASFMWLGVMWLVALSVVLASFAWWWRYRSSLAMAGITLALSVSGVAGVGLIQQSPGHWTYRSANAYVEPDCDMRLDGRAQVCLHPEDEALLGETANEIESLIAPVAGLAGVPNRYENQPASVVFQNPNRAYIGVRSGGDIPVVIDQSVMDHLFHLFRNEPSGEMSYAYGAVKYVIATWLLQEAGVDLSEESQGIHRYRQPLTRVYAYEQAIREKTTEPEELLENASNVPPAEIETFEEDVNAAIDRFAALSSDEQRAWLEANWDALIAGELTLEDLP